MFEKEDFERYMKDSEDYYDNREPITERRLYQLWKDGAEFGYNKANEWKYPSKDEYPKECENVLCYCKGSGVKFCCVGHTIIGGDNKVRWWANNKSEELLVIAWKEIILSKEETRCLKMKQITMHSTLI